MRPVPVPDGVAEQYPDLRRLVIAAPDGDLTSEIRPVDALVGTTALGGDDEAPVFRIYAILEEPELAAVRDGRPVWVELSLYTPRLPVFSIEALFPEADA